MDVGARKFPVSSRPWMTIILLVTLLAASVSWNIRQHGQIEQQRVRTLAAEREQAARAAEVAERAEARMKKNAEWAASDARVQQLYQEIDSLSRINEQVVAQPLRQRSTPSKAVGHEPADGRPPIIPSPAAQLPATVDP